MIKAEEKLFGNFYLNFDFVSPKEKRRFSDKDLGGKIDYLLDQEGVVLDYSGKYIHSLNKFIVSRSKKITLYDEKSCAEERTEAVKNQLEGLLDFSEWVE